MSKKIKIKEEKKYESFFGFLHFVERRFFKLFYPYKRHGNLKKYNEGSLIIIGNHYSYFDVVPPITITDRPIHFVAKEQLYDGGGFFKWLVKKAGCILVKRDGTDAQPLKESLKILKAGGVLNIFPEGTRNRSYKEFLPFRNGAAALSIKTKTPIVPIVKVTRMRLFHRTHVVFGDPIEFREFYDKKVTKEDLQRCDDILRDCMWNMRLAFLDSHPEVKKEANGQWK